MVDFTGGTWRSLIDGSEVGAIPNYSVWDSENSSASFYEDNGTVYAINNALDIRDGEALFIDELLTRDDWEEETEINDVNEDITLSPSTQEDVEFRWAVESNRYVAEHYLYADSNDGTKSGGGMMVLGPWDVSDVDELFYDIRASEDSATQATAIIIGDEGIESESEADDYDIVGEGETADTSIDISGFDGEKMVYVGVGAKTKFELSGSHTDIYFD